jgi:hypothetical protein
MEVCIPGGAGGTSRIKNLPMLLLDVDAIDVHAILVPPLLVRDPDVVPAHLPLPHQPVVRERPVLQPVGPPPLPGLVVPLVPELHGDLVAREGEQLLAQPVPVLHGPLLGQEVRDGVAAHEELVPVTPDAVLRVGQLDLVRVSVGQIVLTWCIAVVLRCFYGPKRDIYFVFQASWAAFTLICAVSAVNGGYGGFPTSVDIVLCVCVLSGSGVLNVGEFREAVYEQII